MLRAAIAKLLRAKPGEERAVGLAFGYFFMLMSAYYLLRPLRDAMASGAVESLFWFYVGTFTVMLFLTPFFGALVSRVRKPLLLPITYAFFASNLAAFYVLFKLMPDSRLLAASFFVWLSAFNMFVVSVFWSFMADVFRDEEAKRLFGPIAAGGGSGALVRSAGACGARSTRAGGGRVQVPSLHAGHDAPRALDGRRTPRLCAEGFRQRATASRRIHAARLRR